MRIDQAGDDQLAGQVVDLGLRSLQFQYVVVAADLEDAFASDGNGLVDAERLVHGGDLAVVEDDVGIGGAELGGREEQQSNSAVFHDGVSGGG